jgi:hypothetical protein
LGQVYLRHLSVKAACCSVVACTLAAYACVVYCHAFGACRHQAACCLVVACFLSRFCFTPLAHVSFQQLAVRLERAYLAVVYSRLCAMISFQQLVVRFGACVLAVYVTSLWRMYPSTNLLCGLELRAVSTYAAFQQLAVRFGAVCLAVRLVHPFA